MISRKRKDSPMQICVFAAPQIRSHRETLAFIDQGKPIALISLTCEEVYNFCNQFSIYLFSIYLLNLDKSLAHVYGVYSS